MRLPRPLIVTLLLGLVAWLPVRAAGQTDAPAAAGSPYMVVVPVSDTSEAQRDQAFATALTQVLVRVSGGQDLRGQPGYDDALKGATGMVQQFQYQRSPGPPAGLALQVTFDQGAVQRAIKQMGVASAGVKPPVLLIVDGSDGNLLGKDALGPLVASAGQRGYAVTYVDPDAVPDTRKLAAADPAALAAVAQQYHTGLVLMGELHGTGADWTLVSGGQSQHWSSQAADGNALLGDAGNAMADRLGKQLNVIGTGAVEGKLWVSGLHSAMDYAGLLSTLRADPSVRQVQTLGADGDGVLLAVKCDMPLDSLGANLAAGGRLMQAQAHDGADASLRWLH